MTKNWKGTTMTAANRAREAVRKAHAKVADVTPNARALFEDPDYTPEGKAKYGGGWLRQGREGVEGAINPARTAAQEAHAAALGRLEEIRTPDNAELQARSAILAPVIAAANENPTALVNAYQKRAGASMADRCILEETAQAMIDAEIGGLKFAEDFGRVRDRLELSEDERDAVSEAEYLEEVENYLNSAEAILETDLTQVERPLHVRETFRRETATAVVNRFESGATGHAEPESVPA